MRTREFAILAAKVCTLLFLTFAVGTAWHEVVGHGLAGVLCGGRIVGVQVLGFEWYPAIRWDGWDGNYGSCTVDGIATATGDELMCLAGSMSTWLVSVVAIFLLWLRRWRPWARGVLILLGIWWIDLFTYTLPVWGLRRSVLWGGRYAEPFEAAVALGVPGWLFQAFVIVSCVALGVALCYGARRFNPRRKG